MPAGLFCECQDGAEWNNNTLARRAAACSVRTSRERRAATSSLGAALCCYQRLATQVPPRLFFDAWPEYSTRHRARRGCGARARSTRRTSSLYPSTALAEPPQAATWHSCSATWPPRARTRVSRPVTRCDLACSPSTRRTGRAAVAAQRLLAASVATVATSSLHASAIMFATIISCTSFFDDNHVVHVSGGAHRGAMRS